MFVKERDKFIQMLAGATAGCLTLLRNTYRDQMPAELLPRARAMAAQRVEKPQWMVEISPADWRDAMAVMMRTTAEGKRLWTDVVVAFVDALRTEQAKRDAADVAGMVSPAGRAADSNHSKNAAPAASDKPEGEVP